ncbi:MAG TPA: pyridoxal phosphate-dependent aminotransferase [Rhodocyclaceae bacterium]
MSATVRTDAIEPFHVVELLTRAKQLEAGGHDVIHMEVGEPDFPTPPGIVAAATDALQRKPLGYTPALGIPELREAIADFYWHQHRVRISPARIVVTAGASGALTLACACLTAPGSRWLLPDPGYPCNRSFVRAFDGQPVPLATSAASNFQPTAEQVANAWNERTGGVILASPSNPTGTVIDPAELAEIAATVHGRGGALVVDEIYSGLVYDSPPTTALAHPGIADEQLWIIQSFSKYWQMTGWRLGWLVVPEAHLRAVEKLAQNLFIAPSTPAQYAALAAFSAETLMLVEARRRAFKQRRDTLVPLLAELGFGVPAIPGGAFYVYADASALTTDSYAYSRRLLETAHVAITPGIDFGQTSPERFVRFAYTTAAERITEAAERIARLCK